MNSKIKIYNKLIKQLCNELNKLIPIKNENDKDKINALIYETYKQIPNFNIYWNRELYINCNGNDKELRKQTLYSGKVYFQPTDDPIEHIGITVKYINENNNN